jgi:hypothetical protein
MKQGYGSLLRRAVLPLATGAVALGAFVGLPALKALAAGQNIKLMPIQRTLPPLARMNIVQPQDISPTAKRLLSIADRALSDDVLAERIFTQPEAVAAEFDLNEQEKLVLRHMTREQFDVARADAARLTEERLAAAGPRRLPAIATNATYIAEGMVVGRAILAAVGRSYLDAANAHGCCPWGHAIELGVNPSRVFYDKVFTEPAALDLRQPGAELLGPNVQAPKPDVQLPRPS